MATRREVLGLFASSALAPGRSARSAKIKAVAFDLLTIFNPRSVEGVARSVVPGRSRELCETWRGRAFEYSWLRTVAGTYRDFQAIIEEALGYASRVHGVTLSLDARQMLVGAYQRLAPWPDAPAALRAMKSAGLRLAPLSNFPAATIETLLANAGLRPIIDEVISTDTARAFKPNPRAYALGPSALGLPREQIAFAAFGGWDAAGAKWFGYPTFWVNRLGVPAEELPPGPDAVGPTLNELAAWVGAR